MYLNLTNGHPITQITTSFVEPPFTWHVRRDRFKQLETLDRILG